MSSLKFSSIEYLYVPSVVPKLIKLKSNFSNVIERFKRKLVFLKYRLFPIYIYIPKQQKLIIFIQNYKCYVVIMGKRKLDFSSLSQFKLSCQHLALVPLIQVTLSVKLLQVQRVHFEVPLSALYIQVHNHLEI